MKTTATIHFRDPYILAVPEEQTYYMYGTDGLTAWSGKPQGFDVYTSQDLQHWEGPYPAFRPDSEFWSDHHFWAPEVHRYEGRYYMFASFKADGACRATQILVSDHPGGPFVPHSPQPVTPKDWECLDGTFYVDGQGTPWMIFCREWLQVTDGEMYAVKLTADLSAAEGDPLLLFRASEAAWSVAGKENQYVTDGPFLHRMIDGELVMLWSSFGHQGYAMGLARSRHGEITGPWLQDPEPIFGEDGGHGMLFQDFEGKLLMTIHTPNVNPKERPVIYELIDRQGTLSLLSTR